MVQKLVIHLIFGGSLFCKGLLLRINQSKTVSPHINVVQSSQND